MKTLAIALLAVVGLNTASAGSALVGNPYLPYPPACAVYPDPYATGGLENQAVKFHQQTADFYDAQTGTVIPVILKAFRSRCSEPGRSLIWLEFSLSRQYGNQAVELALPLAVADVGGERRLMHLAAEATGWANSGWAERGQTYLVNRPNLAAGDVVTVQPDKKWVFLLDNAPHNYVYVYPGDVELSPDEYNGEFTLILRYAPYDLISFEVPSTAALIPDPPPPLYLSGRLSGNWIVAGAPDQGMVISVSERIQAAIPGQPDRAEMPMLLFLAHYTFDANGNTLWLTGAASFGPGTRTVTLPIEHVTNGSFRGSLAADRDVIGSVTITANHCNDLAFSYDYRGIGLGQGEKRLQRIFSLETAGLECRDHSGRVAASR